MITTLWDSFEYLLREAEADFLNFKFQSAVEKWKKYYQITAKTEYQKIIDEIIHNWEENKLTDISSLERLFMFLQRQRDLYKNKKIGHFTFKLYEKLLIKIYQEKFQSEAGQKVSVEVGVFEYLSGDYNSAIPKLQKVIDDNIESIIARVYLGFAYMAIKDQKSAISILSQNLFLAPDQIREDELYLSQFKLLIGRLYSKYSNWEIAAWLLTFESWYRNWLILKEDERFFILMQQKESTERIMQVKYYSSERYRHFMRCLYITEYARYFLKKEKGLIIEQERYMEKLDPPLFARYRKKRKAIKLTESY